VNCVIGLDVGTKTIGVAHSDLLGIIASGTTTIRRQNRDKDFAALAAILELYKPTSIVVGYPRNMNGTVGEQARFVDDFIDELSTMTPLPIHRVDERLSTRQAQRAMIESGLRARKRHAIIDQQAAAVILQGYLDRQSRSGKE
jgi:putative Holliday junction resolvase